MYRIVVIINGVCGLWEYFKYFKKCKKIVFEKYQI